MVVLYQRRVLAAPTAGALPIRQVFNFSLGGLTPVGAIFRVTRAVVSDSGTPQVGATFAVGMTDGTTTLLVATMAENGQVATSNDAGFVQNATNTVLVLSNASETVIVARAVFVSFGANKVEIDWTTALPVAGYLVECEVIYGAGAAFKVGTWTSAASITPGFDTVTITPGFPFGHLFVVSAFDGTASGAHGRMSYGFAAHHRGTITQGAVCQYDRDRHGPGTLIGFGTRNDACAVMASGDPVTAGPRVKVSAVGATTFDLQTVGQATAMVGMYGAVFTGAQRVGVAHPTAAQLGTATAGVKSLTNHGFPVVDIHAVGWRNQVINVAQGGSIYPAFGGSDGTTPAGQCFASDNNVGVSPALSQTCSGFTEAQTLQVIVGTGTTDWEGDYVGPIAGGFEFEIVTASTFVIGPNANRLAFFLGLGTENLILPSAVTLPLVAPAVTRALTLTPTAKALPLVVPAPSVIVLEVIDPSAIALPLVVPPVTRRLTPTPPSVPLALVVPPVTRALTLTPAPALLPLLLGSPNLGLPKSPAAVVLPLVLPPVARALTPKPAALALPLVVPPVVRRVTPTPAAVLLPLVLPAPGITVARHPSAVLVALILPAPQVLTGQAFEVETLELALVLVDPLLVFAPLELTPSPVALLLVVPSPSFGALIAVRIGLEVVRDITFELEAPREVELPAFLE